MLLASLALSDASSDATAIDGFGLACGTPMVAP
jgi:hypothetical protein